MEPQKLTYSVTETALKLGISRALCYDLCRQGKLPSVRLGEKRVVVSAVGLEKMLSERASGLSED